MATVVARSVRYEEFGPASVLHIVDREIADPAPGKVRIAVRAVGLNPADFKVRNGDKPEWNPTLPAGIGRELAGVVEAIGDGATLVNVGDEVFGNVAGSALAEYVLTNPANLAHKPAALDWTLAGSLSTVGQTANSSVESQYLGAGDTVLVSAAAGGVGVVASQLALRTGARVIGTASPSNHAFLESLGVIPVAYGDDLVERLREFGPFTAVLDNHGPDTIEAAIALGVPLDRINSIAVEPDVYGTQGVGRGPIDTAVLEHLADLIVAGELVLPIEKVYPLDEVIAAFEHLEGGHARGKIVVEV